MQNDQEIFVQQIEDAILKRADSPAQLDAWIERLEEYIAATTSTQWKQAYPNEGVEGFFQGWKSPYQGVEDRQRRKKRWLDTSSAVHEAIYQFVTEKTRTGEEMHLSNRVLRDLRESIPTRLTDDDYTGDEPLDAVKSVLQQWQMSLVYKGTYLEEYRWYDAPHMQSLKKYMLIDLRGRYKHEVTTSSMVDGVVAAKTTLMTDTHTSYDFPDELWDDFEGLLTWSTSYEQQGIEMLEHILATAQKLLV